MTLWRDKMREPAAAVLLKPRDPASSPRWHRRLLANAAALLSITDNAAVTVNYELKRVVIHLRKLGRGYGG